jgi:GNAT superfamily N-acetyltransferase
MSTSSIRTATDHDLPALAAFIAARNCQPEEHCLHCGEAAAVVAGEIAQLRWGAARSAAACLLVAEEEGSIVGAIGCDCDDALARAWLWGPFAPPGRWQSLATDLLAALRAALPPSIAQIDAFNDARNLRGQALLRADGFTTAGIQHVYLAAQPEQTQPDPSCVPIDVHQEASFIALHDAIFPGTYADGATLLAERDDQHQVVVYAGDATVLGYVAIAVDADPEEAYIHYLGVRTEARGQGIGRRLLTTALHWAFAERGLAQVALTVSDERNVARRLYEAVGFAHRFTGINDRWTRVG